MLSFDLVTLSSHSAHAPNDIPPFYIEIIKDDMNINPVIINEGLFVNVIPLCLVEDLEIFIFDLYEWIYQGYDKNQKVPLGQVTLPLTLEEKRVLTELTITELDLEYNILLGRPWITQMTTICSSLFSELRFIYKGQLKVIK